MNAQTDLQEATNAVTPADKSTPTQDKKKKKKNDISGKFNCLVIREGLVDGKDQND